MFVKVDPEMAFKLGAVPPGDVLDEGGLQDGVKFLRKFYHHISKNLYSLKEA